MRLLLLMVVLVAVLSPFGVQSVSAASTANCPPRFMLHSVEDMDHMMDEHIMVGAYDVNGDGYICVLHVSSDDSIHVHVDNYFPLQ